MKLTLLATALLAVACNAQAGFPTNDRALLSPRCASIKCKMEACLYGHEYVNADDCCGTCKAAPEEPKDSEFPTRDSSLLADKCLSAACTAEVCADGTTLQYSSAEDCCGSCTKEDTVEPKKIIKTRTKFEQKVKKREMHKEQKQKRVAHREQKQKKKAEQKAKKRLTKREQKAKKRATKREQKVKRKKTRTGFRHVQPSHGKRRREQKMKIKMRMKREQRRKRMKREQRRKRMKQILHGKGEERMKLRIRIRKRLIKKFGNALSVEEEELAVAAAIMHGEEEAEGPAEEEEVAESTVEEEALTKPEYYDAIKCRPLLKMMKCPYYRSEPCDVGFTRRYVGCCRKPVCEEVLTMPVEEEAEGSTEEEEAFTMPFEEEALIEAP